MTPTRALPCLLTAGALVLAGCTAVPDDSAAAAAPAAFDEVLGTVVLDAQAGPPAGGAPRTRVLDAAALPDGRAYVLTAGATVRLVEVVRGDAGPAAGDAVELSGLGPRAALEVTPGGELLVVGSDDDGPVLLTVADGGPAERRVDGPGQVLASALSADGGTVYVGLAPGEETGVPARLLAVDAATGEVTATAPLGAGLDPRARSARLLPRPDGGVVAVISNPQPGGAQDWVAEYDADLGTAVAPFGVVAALGASGHTEVSVGVAGDGDLVVLTEVRDGRRVSRFSSGELLGTVDADLTGPVDAVVAGPPAGLVTLAWGRGGADPVLVSLDPATGALGEPLATCDTLGGHDALAVAPDATWAVAAGACGHDDVVAVLVG